MKETRHITKSWGAKIDTWNFSNAILREEGAHWDFFQVSSVCCKISVSIWRSPVDTKHPVGYTIATMTQYVYLQYSFILCACVVPFSTGVLLYAVVLTKDIKGSLISINKNAKTKKNRLKIHKQICDFAKFHAIFKQLSDYDEFFYQHFFCIQILFQICFWFLWIPSANNCKFFYYQLSYKMLWNAIDSSGISWVSSINSSSSSLNKWIYFNCHTNYSL